MAQTGSRIVILLIFTLYIRPIHTHPSIRHGERLDSHVLLPAASEDSCGFEGNPDLYGLGIRLGIYLQWIATFIANMFPQVQKEIGGLVDTNTIFLLAIFIATVVISSEPIDDGPHTVEILVLLYIFFGTVYSVLLFSSVRASRFGHYQYSVLGLCFRLTLVAAMSAYSVWYWFRGVELFSRTDCGTYAFLFAQVSVFGRALTFFKIAAVLNILLWAPVFSTFTVIILISLFSNVYLAIVDFLTGSQDTASTVFLYCNSLLKPQVHGTVSILRPTLIGISDLLVSLQEKGLFATIRMNSGRWREWQSLMESRRKEHAGKTRSEGGFRALLELMASKSPSELSKSVKKLIRWTFPLRFLEWITPTEQEVTSSFLERVIFIRDFLPSLFSILWPLNIFALCWNTIAIETTIVWNSITNVYDLRSTGQLIAFVIGLAGLLKVLISLWTNWFDAHHEDDKSFTPVDDSAQPPIMAPSRGTTVSNASQISPAIQSDDPRPNKFIHFHGKENSNDSSKRSRSSNDTASESREKKNESPIRAPGQSGTKLFELPQPDDNESDGKVKQPDR